MSGVVRALEFIINQDELIGKTGSVYEIGTPAVKFLVEQLADGTLQLTASVFDNDGGTDTDTADLRGIFFHIAGIEDNSADETWLKGLSIAGSGSSASFIEGRALDADGVASVPGAGNSDNMNGRPLTPYDVGIGIGTSGIGRDDVKTVTIILDHVTENLTLEHLALQGFGARLTSVGADGTKRDDSLKLWGLAPSAPPLTPPAGPTGSLSGRVWLDLDKDGVQDDGGQEVGLSGVEVKLIDFSGKIVSIVVTGDDGEYRFSDVSYGTYNVQFGKGPDGTYQFTNLDAGSDDTLDSDADASTGRTVSYMIDETTRHVTAVDAGLSKVEVQLPVVVPPQEIGNDDLIEAGDHDDFIHGGSGNDEMQGEGGNDTIYGGTDRGEIAWNPGNGKLKKVLIGDNLYGNDGQDTYRYAKGDGVDMIWDFRPGDDVIELTGYSLKDIKATWVGKVANWIDTPKHNKLALVFSDGGAIVFNDYSGLDSSSASALKLSDGTVVKFADLIAMAGRKPADLEVNDERQVALRKYEWRDVGKGQNGFGGNDRDKLIGADGDDNLYGNEGVNGLNGKEGNDQLFGGNTRDVMIGGNGDDIGYGNGGDDLIVGGAGSDRLYGTGGADYIFGDEMPSGFVLPSTFAGDLVWLQEEKTVVTSSSMTLVSDAINITASGTTALTLTGNSLNNVMIGNAGKNMIAAVEGDDMVFGGYGNDTLSGGTGKDKFVFDQKLGSSSTDRRVNFDTITDFKMKDDKFYLNDAVFKKLGKGSPDKPSLLSKNFFTVGTQAKDKNDYLVYDKKTGILSYDADGSGTKAKAVEFAKIDADITLKHSHFYLI
ncbi:SdrD B-like domain-containing protein [Microvirga sp. CF3062]|uniref:SdrD B-like domain-containing protein n=1 Tax=Microvirga sp. CF3062 TaxID=3110182 RepID=UPI002E768852|nr:SdrD B-like domain-containing protein [Microvirga sp. CF3062]MEE1657673.1 SdrD B-like domain-containing protein [Microvirga sp. CF3062]